MSHLDEDSARRLNAAAKRMERGLRKVLAPEDRRAKGLRVLSDPDVELLSGHRRDLVITLRELAERAKAYARKLVEP